MLCEPIKVSSLTKSPALVEAILDALEDDPDEVVLKAVGHRAVGCAMEAVAIVRSRLVPEGRDFYVLPSLETIEGVTGDDLPVITLTIEPFEEEDE